MAETEILRQGSWESQRFSAAGAMLVEVLVPGGLHAGVAVDGLTAPMRNRSPRSGAFPLQAVPAEITVLAVAQGRAPFPGGARVDLSVSFPSAGRSFLIQNLDIAGHERAPLVRLIRDGDAWLLRPHSLGDHAARDGSPRAERGAGAAATAATPAAGWPADAAPASAAPAVVVPAVGAPAATREPSASLGSWAARRAAEVGVPARPQIAELVVDTSVSMAQHHARAERLCRFVSALARATGAAEPRVRQIPIGTSAHAGVGSVLGTGTAGEAGELMSAEERRVVITDLPVLHAEIQSLVIGDAAILEVLADSGAEVFVPDEGAWTELDRQDSSYTDQTVQRLEPLMRWLAGPAPELKEGR